MGPPIPQSLGRVIGAVLVVALAVIVLVLILGGLLPIDRPKAEFVVANQMHILLPQLVLTLV